MAKQRHPIEVYLFEEGISQTNFAKALDISRVHLGRIIRHDVRPGVDLARKIESETEGSVSKEELVFFEDYLC